MNTIKTETHYKYAKTLCRQYFKGKSNTFKSLFVLGCVAPDYDIFSYFKGFSVRRFYGHNWTNAKKYLNKKLEQLENNTLNPFSLGRLVHHLCDAFTFVHNEHYKGGLLFHKKYEEKMHSLYKKTIRTDNKCDLTFDLRDSLVLMVDKLHRQYEREQPSIENDIKYITFLISRVLSEYSEKVNSSSTADAVG